MSAKTIYILHENMLYRHVAGNEHALDQYAGHNQWERAVSHDAVLMGSVVDQTRARAIKTRLDALLKPSPKPPAKMGAKSKPA